MGGRAGVSGTRLIPERQSVEQQDSTSKLG